MEERNKVSRRQAIALGGIMAIGVTAAGLARDCAEARTGEVTPQERAPCVGEPGYAERVADLFKDQ